MPGKRLYNEKEIGELIQRATELHEEGAGGSEGTLSLEEVEHIASELGISSKHVRRAALELGDKPERRNKFSLTGAPFAVDHSCVVDEAMDEEQWEFVVAELRRLTGAKGNLDSIGQTREWSRTVEDMGTTLYGMRVSARSDGQQTTISVKKHFGGLAVLFYFFPLFFSILGAVIVLHEVSSLPALLNILILGGTVIGVFSAIRTGIHLWSGRQKENLKSLVERIQRTISMHAPIESDSVSESAPELEASEAGLLEIPEEPAEELDVRMKQRTRS